MILRHSSLYYIPDGRRISIKTTYGIGRHIFKALYAFTIYGDGGFNL